MVEDCAALLQTPVGKKVIGRSTLASALSTSGNEVTVGGTKAGLLELTPVIVKLHCPVFSTSRFEPPWLPAHTLPKLPPLAMVALILGQGTRPLRLSVRMGFTGSLLSMYTVPVIALELLHAVGAKV